MHLWTLGWPSYNELDVKGYAICLYCLPTMLNISDKLCFTSHYHVLV
jgi:hypothetical protein